MAELILFPDVEDVLCTWLAARLAAHGSTVPVATRVPDPRPDRFVRLIRTGGRRHTIVTDAALITVESWGERETDAVTLADLCRALLHSAPGTVPSVTVYRVTELSGPQNLPDPVTAQTRYTQTFEIHLRGAAV